MFNPFQNGWHSEKSMKYLHWQNASESCPEELWWCRGCWWWWSVVQGKGMGVNFIMFANRILFLPMQPTQYQPPSLHPLKTHFRLLKDEVKDVWKSGWKSTKVSLVPLSVADQSYICLSELNTSPAFQKICFKTWSLAIGEIKYCM